MKLLLRLMTGKVAGTAGWAMAAVAISTVTGILTARSLGPEHRGTLALVLSIAGLCVLVSAFGTNVAVRRHLPQRDLVNRRGYERVSLILLAPLAIVLASTLFLVTTLVDPTFGRWQVGVAFIGYGVSFYFSNQALDLLNALGLVKLSAKVNAIGSFICLILVGFGAAFGLGLDYMIWAYSISVICQVGLVAVLAHARTKVPGSQAKGVRVLLRDGGQLLGLNLGQSLTYRSDTILLGALSGQFEVGNYAVATTPAAVLRIPANALGQVLFHETAMNAIDARAVLRRILVLLAMLVPIAAVGWIFADWLFPTVFGPGYTEAVWPFRFLLIAEIFLTPFLVLGRALAGGGSTWGASACGVLGVSVLVGSCLLLIPSLGATGAALASVLAYASMSVLAVVLFVRSQGTHTGQTR